MRVKQTPNLNSTNQSSTSHCLLRRKRLATKTFESYEKKKKRRKPGTVALKQIRYFQSNTDYLLKLRPFCRLVKEIADSYSPPSSNGTPYRWKPDAIIALQAAVEAYLVILFEDINNAAIHAKRITIRPEDLRLVRTIRANVNEHEIY